MMVDCPVGAVVRVTDTRTGAGPIVEWYRPDAAGMVRVETTKDNRLARLVCALAELQARVQTLLGVSPFTIKAVPPQA
jgi:hypothetical protein